jgi:hypothetical protein
MGQQEQSKMMIHQLEDSTTSSQMVFINDLDSCNFIDVSSTSYETDGRQKRRGNCKDSLPSRLPHGHVHF